MQTAVSAMQLVGSRQRDHKSKCDSTSFAAIYCLRTLLSQLLFLKCGNQGPLFSTRDIWFLIRTPVPGNSSHMHSADQTKIFLLFRVTQSSSKSKCPQNLQWARRRKLHGTWSLVSRQRLQNVHLKTGDIAQNCQAGVDVRAFADCYSAAWMTSSLCIGPDGCGIAWSNGEIFWLRK